MANSGLGGSDEPGSWFGFRFWGFFVLARQTASKSEVKPVWDGCHKLPFAGVQGPKIRGIKDAYIGRWKG